VVLRKALIWIGALILLIGGAMAAARALLPGLVRDGARDWVATNLPGKQLALGDISFDPLRLVLVIDRPAISDGARPAQPLVAARQLTIDVSAASLLRFHTRLDALRIDGPQVDAVLAPDGRLNLATLLPPDDGSPPPDVFIRRLEVTDGRLRFTDGRQAQAAAHLLTPISFSLADFTTRANDGGGFTLDAGSEAGERFHWAGTLGMAPVASDGDFRITALQLATIAKFAGDLLPAAPAAGTLDLAGRYRFALRAAVGKAAPQTSLAVDVRRLALAGLAASTMQGDRIALASLELAPTRLDLAADRIDIGAVKLAGLDLAARDGRLGRLAGLTLAPSRYTLSSGAAALGDITLSGLVLGSKAQPDAVTLASADIAASRIDSSGRRLAVGAVQLAGLKARARLADDIALLVPGVWPLPPMPAPTAAGKAETQAWHTNLAGLTLADAALDLNMVRAGKARTLRLHPVRLELGALDTAAATPVPVAASLRLDGRAQLTARGAVTTAGGGALEVALSGLRLADYVALAGPLPVDVRAGTLAANGRARLGAAPRFDGRLAVAGLDVRDGDGNNLVAWQQMEASGIAASAKALRIRCIRFDRAVSHVVVNPAREINLMTLAASDATAPPAAATAPDVSAPISDAASRIGALVPTRIDRVDFAGSTIAFEDLSHSPSFAARIEGFEGQISGLDSRPGTQASFDLKGYVIDRFSPVSITGKANVFAYDAATDVTADFRNIELPVFNPYSGRYAGYAIARGKLSTRLHYRIDNRALVADHNVRIEQLQWGQATESQEKVPLPIRLATGLLKDKDGVIDLDLPVRGTLDDPSFRIWPVVWKIVGNVVTKVITAPFRLIGGLFGGKADPQKIGFAPGSADLPAEAAADLGKIAKAFADRPEVNLDIPAGPAGREDAEALAAAALHRAVLDGKPGKPPLAADYASLPEDRKYDRLKDLLKARRGKGADFPDDVKEKPARIAWAEAQLLPGYAASDADLAKLGQARADAIRQALLADGSIDPGRVFISTALAGTASNDQVVVELKVK
jgi:hypothetical protein